MRPTTVTIYNNVGDPVDIQAFTTATPGIVVHASNGDPGWSVTHERSGMSLMMVDDPEWAQAAAAELAPITDWTLSGNAIAADDVTMSNYRAIRSKWSGKYWSADNDPDAYADRRSA